jgi:RNA polymerase sigma-70 factor (ECF subfamily)
VVIPDAETEMMLVIQAQDGDRNAYGELVRRHQRGVVQVILRLCGDAELAQDAAQDAFLQAWIHLPDFHAGDSASSLRSWLYRIAVNRALDSLRRATRLVEADLDSLALPDPADNPESALLHKERQAAVQDAILSLSEASRSVLVLREYGGLSYQEIAAALDIPLGTVMSRLSYARSQLRQSLQPYLNAMEMENV